MIKSISMNEDFGRMPLKSVGVVMAGIFLFIFSAGVISLEWAYARDEVKSTQHLNLLRQATGGTTSSGTYQSQLDAILTTTTDAARSTVARQDAEEALLTAGPEEEDLLESGVSVLPSNYEKRRIEEPKEKTPRLEGMLESRIEGDLTTQDEKRLEEMYKEMDEKAQKKVEEAMKPVAEEETKTKSNLRPSLANNPFYFAPDDQRKFEEDKPILISRLVQAGFEKEDAESVITGASGPDEVILHLIQEDNYTYGEASDLVRTTS